MGFIQNSRAVLLLAACRTPKSDRLLGEATMKTSRGIGAILLALVQQGAEPGFGPPGQFEKLLRAEYADLAPLIKSIGMKLN